MECRVNYPENLDLVPPETVANLPAMERRLPYQMTPKNLGLVLPEEVASLSAVQDFVLDPCKSCGKEFVLARPIRIRRGCASGGCTTTNYCSVQCHQDSLRACGCDNRRDVCPCRECKGSDCEVRLCFSSQCSLLSCSGCSGIYCSPICKGGTQCDLCHRGECESCTLRCSCGTKLCSDCGKDGCLHCRLGPHKSDCKDLTFCYCCSDITCRCKVRLDEVGYHLCEECANDAKETCASCQIERERSKLYRS